MHFSFPPMHAACSTILVPSNFITLIVMGYNVIIYVPTDYHFID